MDFNEYWQSAGRTYDSSEPNLYNYAMGLPGEVGELLEVLKKHYFHGRPFNRERIVDEAGDVLWYLTALMFKLGITMNEVAINNIEKLLDRYPDGLKANRKRSE
jgi:NTP pyrophosphatase (non-canonical NTP hydrolase)